MKVTKSGRHARADRTPGPDPGLPAGAGRHLPGAFSAARSSLSTLVGRIPGALGATTAGAREAARALQALPDPTLRWLAAGSVGLGAGLFITGKPRFVVAAGVAPAIALGAAIIGRPIGRPVAQRAPHIAVDLPATITIPEARVAVMAVAAKGETSGRAGSHRTRPGNGVSRA